MAIELVNKKENVSLQGNSANVNFMMPNMGKVKSVNGKTGDVVLTAADVGAVQDTFDTFLYGDGKWMLGINKEGKVQPTQSYSAPTLDSDALKDYATKEYVENYSQVVSAPIYRSEGNKHYINLRELVPNALYSIPKEIILQNSIANFNLVVLADDGTEQFIYATTRSELFYVSKIGSFLLLYIQGLSYYVQINCRNTATSTDITFNRYVQYLSSSINYEFTPTKDYHPATKKYVDDAVTNIDIPEVSVDGLVSFAEAQDLTDEQRKQARDNIAQYKYNFIETKYSIMKSYIADYSEYVSPVSRVDMELANSITGLASASYSSLSTISFNLKSLATSPKNEGTIKNIVAEYENMKANGCLGNNYCYFAIGDGKGNAIAKIIINLSNSSAYTHNIQFSESDEGYTGTIKWDNSTQTVYQNGVTRKYIDTTLTRENYYADAKAVGDRFKALEAQLEAIIDGEEVSY